MTVQVHVIQTPVGNLQRRTYEEGALIGRPVVDYLVKHRDPRWSTKTPVRVLLNGIHIEGDLWNEIPLDGDHVVISPDLGAFHALGVPLVIDLFLTAATAFALYSLSNALAPKFARPQQRGDESSPTYAWQGVDTGFGPGLAKPVIYGEMRVGGVVIHSSFVDERIDFSIIGKQFFYSLETLRVLIALSEGPIYRVDDYNWGACGEVNDIDAGIGNALDNLKINDVRVPGRLPIGGNHFIPVAKASLRAGHPGQSPVEHWGDDVSSSYSVSQELSGAAEFIYETASSSPDRATLRIRFPGGLFKVNGSKMDPYPVQFSFFYREKGTTPWADGGKLIAKLPIGTRRSMVFDHTIKMQTKTNVVTWELKVRRDTADDDASSLQTQSQSILETVVEARESDLAYPNTALLGLKITATESIEGKFKKATIPVKGRTLSRYNGTSWNDEEWDDGSGKVTAENPAWVLADYLTNERYGLGRWFKKSDLDADSFKAWADYCDTLVTHGSVSEPRHRFDGVFDRQIGAWEGALSIARVGRATLVPSLGKIKVVYDDIKPRVQMFSSAAISEFGVTWLNTRDLPNIVSIRILNRELDWQQDEILIEDTEAKINTYTLDRVVPRIESIDGFGITRPSQARREGIYIHRRSAIRNQVVNFKVSILALAAEVGDRIAIEHWAARWHDEPDSGGGAPTRHDSYGYRASRTVSAGNAVYLDHEITLEASKTYQVLIQSKEDVPEERTISAPAGTYPADTAISFSGSAVNFNQGTQIAIGEATRVVKDFVISKITMDQGLMREVEAITYDETIFDIPSAQELSDGGISSNMVSVHGVGGDTPSSPTGLRLRRDLLAGDWLLEFDTLKGGPFRAYGSAVGDVEPWALLGESDSSPLILRDLPPGKEMDFTVVGRLETGKWGTPGHGNRERLYVDEFPDNSPPVVELLTTQVEWNAVRLEWERVQDEDLDCYEVRLGPTWLGARVVLQTRDTKALIPLPSGSGTLLVRALSKSGIYSPKSAEYAFTAGYPKGTGLIALDWDFLGSAHGTPTDMTFDASSNSMDLDAGKYRGIYESAVLDAGSPETYWWSVFLQQDVLDEGTLVEAMTMDVRSGEARWWEVEGREASPARPGIDRTSLVDTGWPTTTMVEDQSRTVHGKPGAKGRKTSFLVEARFDTDGTGAWTPYKPWTEGFYTAQKMQVRVTVDRSPADLRCRLRNLILTAAL